MTNTEDYKNNSLEELPDYSHNEPDVLNLKLKNIIKFESTPDKRTLNVKTSGLNMNKSYNPPSTTKSQKYK